jgi:molecular chaperone GrpE
VEDKERKAHTISNLDSKTDENSSLEPETPLSLPEDDVSRALAAKTDECQALQDKLLRLAAEFENYKRLAQRDQREYSRFANEQLLKALLPVVDNLERAIQSAKASPDSNTVIEGVQLTLKQFLEVLSKAGVQPIASVGQPFDPARHQAVTRVENAHSPENTVMEELQKGYLLHERVLRPAMVAVATGGSHANGSHSEESTSDNDRLDS